ncbi:MAG: hemolysin family protein, partial [Nitrospinota bacterium]
LFAVLLGCSAFFSASETAFFSLSRFRVQRLREEGGGGRRVAGLLDRPRRLIITILTGNELVNVAASALFASLTIAVLGEGRGWVAILIMTPLLMLFGEIGPKTLAVKSAEPLARAFSLPLGVFAASVTPLRWFFLQLSERLLRLLGGGRPGPGNILVEEEFRALVDVGHEAGELEPVEHRYIHNIFEFTDEVVSDIMVPRTDMVCWEDTLNLGEVVERVRSAPFSRIPLCHEDRDHIVGVLYIKDFLRLSRQRDFDPSAPIPPSLIREPHFVPSGMRVGELFLRLRQGRTHMAIVADEFGGVAGLVTMEDLLERIFGELADEFDSRAEPLHQPQADGSHIFLGRIPLEDFSAIVGWHVPEDAEAETLGGFLFDRLGRVPRRGEKLSLNGLEFTVAEVRKTRIVKVRVSRVEEA